MRVRRVPPTNSAALLSVLLLLSACASHTPYRAGTHGLDTPWLTDLGATADSVHMSIPWWRALGDPALDPLVESAFRSSPTVEHALARVDEARANLARSRAEQRPSVESRADVARTRGEVGAIGDGTQLSRSASLGLAFGWEVDLFGRARLSRESATRRLEARHADIQGARLVLAAETATTLVTLRACRRSLTVRRQLSASRQHVLDLTADRAAVGLVAIVELARATTSLAEAKTQEVSTREQCEQAVHALAALTGRSVRSIDALIEAQAVGTTNFDAPQSPPAIPLPAEVLTRNPSVVVAERELAAAWSDIGVASAARLPRLDLASLLTGQWLRVGGSTADDTTASLAASLTAPLFDGGRRSADVQAAQARYRYAAASVEEALLTTWRSLEDALSALDSAHARLATTQQSQTAARALLRAAEAQWRAGAIGLIELEDAHRLYSQAEDSAITATRDTGRAWIALVRASGNSALFVDHQTHAL